MIAEFHFADGSPVTIVAGPGTSVRPVEGGTLIQLPGGVSHQVAESYDEVRKKLGLAKPKKKKVGFIPTSG